MPDPSTIFQLREADARCQFQPSELLLCVRPGLVLPLGSLSTYWVRQLKVFLLSPVDACATVPTHHASCIVTDLKCLSFS